MRNFLLLVLVTTIFALSSCVSRVSIPEGEQPQLVIDLQMLRGSDNIFAAVHTSTNLNGSFPIENPDNVEIFVDNGSGIDVPSQFVYNPETKVYDYVAGQELVNVTSTLSLSAQIRNSEIPGITASSRVPKYNELVDTELIASRIVSDNEGEFWEGTIRFNLEELNINTSEYYHLMLNEKLQTKEETVNGPVYTTINPEESLFEVIDVTSGEFAVREFLHTDGLWIDLDEMDADFFEVTIRSTIPMTLEGQTSDNIFAKLYSITEEHYNYNLGLSNMESSESSLYGEQGLYRSNINRGFGIFSACVMKRQTINLIK